MGKTCSAHEGQEKCTYNYGISEQNKDILESGRRWRNNIKIDDIRAQRDGASGTLQAEVRGQW